MVQEPKGPNTYHLKIWLSPSGNTDLKTGMKAEPAMALMRSRFDEKFLATVLEPSMTLVTEMCRRPLAST